MKDVLLHKNFMIYSYSITLTAITFRIIKYLFFDYKLLSYDLFYGLDVWISLILNLIIAQLIIKKITSQYKCILTKCK